MCRQNADWDSPLPDDLRASWEQWRQSLPHLETLEVKRCFKPAGFGKVISTEVHHFSDASTRGYGQCSYLRLVDDKNRIHCTLLMGKARVTPLKPVTIPRLELTAAVVSVKVSGFLHEELDLESATEFYWTDSKVVLGYISNDTRRFHVFVANRVQRIREHSEASQWHYVKSEDNPADDASRGLDASEFVKNPRWTTGPAFLWSNTPIEATEQSYPLCPSDPEVKDAKVFAISAAKPDPKFELERFDYFSRWYRLTRAFANCFVFIRRLKNRVASRKNPQHDTPENTSHD